MAKKTAKVHRRKMRQWQLQTAKARFSELVRTALAEGPQCVTRQGEPAVVVVPAEEFEILMARAAQPENLVEFFARSPLAGAEIDLERSEDYGREVDL